MIVQKKYLTRNQNFHIYIIKVKIEHKRKWKRVEVKFIMVIRVVCDDCAITLECDK